MLEDNLISLEDFNKDIQSFKDYVAGLYNRIEHLETSLKFSEAVKGALKKELEAKNKVEGQKLAADILTINPEMSEEDNKVLFDPRIHTWRYGVELSVEDYLDIANSLEYRNKGRSKDDRITKYTMATLIKDKYSIKASHVIEIHNKVFRSNNIKLEDK
jgi:hypothetical protein